MLDTLKALVCTANLELVRQGLVSLTWGIVDVRNVAEREWVICPEETAPTRPAIYPEPSS